MTEPKNELQALFQPQKRFSHFGNVIVDMTIRGIRNHESTHIAIESPITAFCGMNGAGKSTLLQLAAASYNIPSGLRYYLSSFILAGKWDEKPFRSDASMEICYAQPLSGKGVPEEKRTTISRSGSSWSGYDRQPDRNVFYFGLGFHIPIVERDVEYKKMFEEEVFRLAGKEPIEEIVRQKVSQVLLCGYCEANMITIHKKRARTKNRLISAQRNEGPKYSEANMGSGEARVYTIIERLESIPEKSLVLIEEPETSLHPSAQFELGRYFIDVSKRRGLQIMLTTHSEYLLLALPKKSRVFLKREGSSVKTISEIGVRQAISMMDELAIPSLYIMVEDDVAETIVRELLRKYDEEFLTTVRIFAAGDKDKISTVMHVFQEQKMPVCAVRDGDFGAEQKIKMFRLFGDEAPEKEIFGSASFREGFANNFGIEWANIDLHNAEQANHHRWFDILITKTARTRQEILTHAASYYLAGIQENEKVALVEQIKAVIP